MRTVLLFISLIISGLAFQNKPRSTKWVITSGCSLKVDGSTNVNNFSCTITNYSRPDTITVTKNTNQVLLSGNLQLDVQNFDCRNPIMTSDLRKTLKSKEFPKLGIYFLSMEGYPDSKGDVTKGLVVIALAGVSKRFEVNYQVVSAGNGEINLLGTREVHFSDFNLTPPRKLGGMIKANNELQVVFNLKMKVME